VGHNNKLALLPAHACSITRRSRGITANGSGNSQALWPENNSQHLYARDPWVSKARGSEGSRLSVPKCSRVFSGYRKRESEL